MWSYHELIFKTSWASNESDIWKLSFPLIYFHDAFKNVFAIFIKGHDFYCWIRVKIEDLIVVIQKFYFDGFIEDLTRSNI